jgi:hypothetical protein
MSNWTLCSNSWILFTHEWIIIVVRWRVICCYLHMSELSLLLGDEWFVVDICYAREEKIELIK